MQTEIVWNDGVSFKTTSGSGHTVITDGPEAFGGCGLGPRPMELMLMGLGSCSAYDVVTILKRGRQALTGCRVELHAERAPHPPKVFERITLHFVLTGERLSRAKVERALALSSQKYCSASIMLDRAGVELAHTFEILEAERA